MHSICHVWLTFLWSQYPVEKSPEIQFVWSRVFQSRDELISRWRFQEHVRRAQLSKISLFAIIALSPYSAVRPDIANTQRAARGEQRHEELTHSYKEKSMIANAVESFMYENLNIFGSHSSLSPRRGYITECQSESHFFHHRIVDM